MSNFVLTKQHLWEVLIFCFNWKKSAVEAHRMFVEVCVTLLQLINHVGNGFDDFKDGDFSVEDKPRPGQSKKFEDKELDIIRRRSESNARGACRIIGDNSTSCFC